MLGYSIENIENLVYKLKQASSIQTNLIVETSLIYDLSQQYHYSNNLSAQTQSPLCVHNAIEYQLKIHASGAIHM